jgi:hypothetical protein
VLEATFPSARGPLTWRTGLTGMTMSRRAVSCCLSTSYIPWLTPSSYKRLAS